MNPREQQLQKLDRDAYVHGSAEGRVTGLGVVQIDRHIPPAGHVGRFQKRHYRLEGAKTTAVALYCKARELDAAALAELGKAAIAQLLPTWNYSMKGCMTSHGLPIITAANGHLIASLCSHNERHARLIAAAPALLEAARQVADQLQSAMSSDASEADFEGCARMRDALREAIAGAEGKS